MNTRSDLQAHLDTTFQQIQRRIAANEARTDRHRRWGLAAGAGAAALALTGGALAVVQATNTGKTLSFCFESAERSAAWTEIGAAPVDGTVRPITDIGVRVRLAEDQCAAAWHIGIFSEEGPSESYTGAVPKLFTCLREDGRLAVYPIVGDVDCAAVGLTEP